MKKYLFTGLLLAAVAVATVIGAQVVINGMQDDITYEETVLFGSRTAAEGISVRSKMGTIEDALMWTSDLQIGSDDKLQVKNTFRTETPEEDIQRQEDIFLDVNLSGGSGGSVGIEPPSNEPLKSIVTDVASRTKPSETHTEKVKLSDYCDVLPVNTDLSDDLYSKTKSAREYFHFPVPDYITVTTEIKKNVKGKMTHYGTDCFAAFNETQTLMSPDGYYFTIFSVDHRDKISGDGVPENGYPIPKDINGIHFIPYIEATKNSEKKLPDFDSAYLAYPLGGDAKPLGFQQSADGTRFYLVTREKDEIYLSVIDTKTCQLMDKVFLRKAGKSNPVNKVLAKENSILVFFEDNTFTLLSKENGKYQLKMKAQNDSFYPPYTADFDYDGEHLAVVVTKGERIDYYIQLFVYTADGPVFAVEYKPSVDHGNIWDINDEYCKTPVTVTLPG